jgi:hypothetical protein
MKQSILFFSVVLLYSFSALSQNIINPAAPGFDTLRSGIPHGKIDTISYTSKTVGTRRRSLIYTPPGFSKTKVTCNYGLSNLSIPLISTVTNCNEVPKK